VTITAFQVEKVKIGSKRHAKKALVFFVQFSGALSATAAQNLAPYTVFAGKMKKIHKVTQVLYNKPVPLVQSIYNPSADTVILLPRGKHTLPKLEQLQVNVSLLTDPQGRPINNGKNFSATVTHSGLIISPSLIAASSDAPAPAAIDALFERGLVPSVQSLAKRPHSAQSFAPTPLVAQRSFLES